MPLGRSSISLSNIMSKKYFYSAVFFTVNLVFSYSQHNDLTEYGLKEKVKVATSLSYQILKTENGRLVPTDTAKWYRKEIIYFNQKGNVDSVSYFVQNRYYKSYELNPDTSRPSYYCITKKYFYDAKGRKKSGISTNNYSKQPSLINITWPAKNLYVEATTVKGYYQIQSVDSIWIGKNGRDSCGSYSIFREDGLMPVSRYDAFYNDKNELDHYNEYGLLLPLGEISVITSEIWEKDKIENPTLIMLKENGDPELISIKYRSYVYY
jgi:hypothetical protein